MFKNHLKIAWRNILHNSTPGDGLAWLQGIEFSHGIIEVDIKGKDVRGRSFVGIAFNGVDDTTYDAVYFRPFNFSDNSKGHSVQYISHPDYPWYRLRNDHPGKYENPVKPVPDGNAFFHAKIIVQKPRVSVYVNGSEEPSLMVKGLSNSEKGRIGLWLGNYLDGTFANLTLMPAEETLPEPQVKADKAHK